MLRPKIEVLYISMYYVLQTLLIEYLQTTLNCTFTKVQCK